jgi:hypothetical protein
MKKIFIALVTAFLIGGQFFTQVEAAPISAVLTSGYCGDTYTVQHLDYLAKIARNCGTTVANILALNPQIINPSLIYTGQVLRLTGAAPIPYFNPYFHPYFNPYFNPYTNRNTTHVGNARVSLSTTRAGVGDAVTVYVSGFPANSEIDYRVGKQGENFSVAYDGTVGSDGATHQTITIPSSANEGEYWVVHVLTTSQTNEVEVYSYPIYINYTSITGYARVSLSTTRADVGGTVTVYVSGFPANSQIDYRVGKQGQNFSVVYDGTVGSDGTTHQTITIPSSANAGEYWVVHVLTTSLNDEVGVYSSSIYITN